MNIFIRKVGRLQRLECVWRSFFGKHEGEFHVYDAKGNKIILQKSKNSFSKRNYTIPSDRSFIPDEVIEKARENKKISEVLNLIKALRKLY